MKRISILLVVSLLLLMCDQKGHRNIPAQASESDTSAVPVVVKKAVTDELAGGAYRKKADGYRVVNGKDTSDFVCIFTESKENGRVGLDFYFTGGKCSRTYRRKMQELEMILPVAAKDYDFTQFRLISMGRLIESGDLAADISKQFAENWGGTDDLKDYRRITEFLRESRLGTSIDSLLKPYSLKVESVVAEKIIFTTREDLYLACKLEQDTTLLPQRILDCITWVNLGVRNP